jgi:hypothetical protein
MPSCEPTQKDMLLCPGRMPSGSRFNRVGSRGGDPKLSRSELLRYGCRCHACPLTLNVTSGVPAGLQETYPRRLARLGGEHRGLRILADQLVGVEAVDVGVVPYHLGRRVRRDPEPEPHRFGTVVDRLLARVLGVLGALAALAPDVGHGAP